MKRNILFIEWKSFGNIFIKQSFQKRGYNVESILLSQENNDTKNNTIYAEKLVHRILNGSYACVFTFNYFPIVAMVCKACKVPYISWTYDSPFVQLYSKTIEYETNFVFVFDSHTVRELRDMGYDNVFYLPMAVPDDYYINMQKKKYDKKIYNNDISFVGSLYNEDFHNPFRKMKNLEGYYKGMIDAVVQAQKKIYGYNFLQEVLQENPELVKQIYRFCPVTVTEDSLESMEWVYANYYLARKVTAEDREQLLKFLSKDFYVTIYTPEKTNISVVENRGKVDYYTEAPYVFSNSKINLNITLRSIQTGIPLRAFDIMGNGGFLLTNYQEDYMEYFEPDKDLVMYASYEEAAEKVIYYLKNDEERKKIANNALNKVMKEHTYTDRVNVMCSFIEEYWG
mgnify:CR=1 FL=1